LFLHKTNTVILLRGGAISPLKISGACMYRLLSNWLQLKKLWRLLSNWWPFMSDHPNYVLPLGRLVYPVQISKLKLTFTLFDSLTSSKVWCTGHFTAVGGWALNMCKVPYKDA
jgi:hypothetical protein